MVCQDEFILATGIILGSEEIVQLQNRICMSLAKTWPYKKGNLTMLSSVDVHLILGVRRSVIVAHLAIHPCSKYISPLIFNLSMSS